MAEAPQAGTPSEKKTAPGANSAMNNAGIPAAAGKPASPSAGNPGDYLEIKAEPQRAVMTIKGAIAAAGLSLTHEDVAKKLLAMKVVRGVDWPAVDRMIDGKQYDRGQIIAQGRPPKP